MYLLLASALASPFKVLEGERLPKDLSWLHVVQLEACPDMNEGSLTMTVEPSGRVSSILLRNATSEQRTCLETQASKFSFKKRGHEEGTRFLLTLGQRAAASLDAPIEGGSVLRGDSLHIAYGAPTVEGSLKIREVKEVVRSFHRRLQSCYEAEQMPAELLVGALTLRIEVDAEGIPRDLREVENGLADPTVATCLEDKFMQMRFRDRSAKTKRSAMITQPMELVK